MITCPKSLLGRRSPEWVIERLQDVRFGIPHQMLALPTAGRYVVPAAERSIDVSDRKNKNYSGQFKQEAMDLVRVRGYDVARAARDLGVPVTILNLWLKKAGWVRPPEGPVDPVAERLRHPGADQRPLGTGR